MKIFIAVARGVTMSLLTAIAGVAVAQQPYPNKPIRVITPYPPGGSTSILIRMIGQKFTESWGQPVIADNRGGGNTIIGSEAVAKAPPDGYTLMLTSSSHVAIPLLVPTPYDPIKDFAPVATVTKIDFAVVVHPSVPASNLQEFIALAKAKPGQLNYASAGSGGPQQLAGELFKMMAGINVQEIPYKGTGPAITDLVGGQVQLYFSPPITALPHIKSGRLRAIAVTAETRMSALPQVATFTESGLPGFNMYSWNGVFAPAGTPKPIVDKLSTEIGKILALADIREKLVSQGMQPLISTPEQFAAMMKAEMAKFSKIIKTANIKLEN